MTVSSVDPLWWRALRAHVYAVAVIGLFLGLLPWVFIEVLLGRHLWTIPPSPTGTTVVGAVIAALGGSLSYTCMIRFVDEGKGTAFPTDPPRVFVVTGPYRWLRNPMYSGNVLLAVGVGFLLSSFLYLLYIAVLFTLTHWYVVRVEEPRLRLRFGSSYKAYCASTPR